MEPLITVFERSPDRGRGLARDMAVRWALEEAGLGYSVRGVSFEALRLPEHLDRQPFGQIPAFEAGGVAMFESGAIVLHLASRCPDLLPEAPGARARALSWLFAAFSTVEPPIVERESFIREEGHAPWFAERLPICEERVRRRLRSLSDALGARDWLEGDFSVADLAMVTVLRRLAGSSLLSEVPGLEAYVARGEARPAFRRAFEAQLSHFRRGEALA